MTVKEYRISLAWSVSELARRAGVTNRTVNRIEDGAAVYDYTAGAIAKALSEGLGKTITIHDLEGVKMVDIHLDGIDTRLEGIKEETRAIKDQQNGQGQDIIEIKRHLDTLDEKLGQVLVQLVTLTKKLE